MLPPKEGSKEFQVRRLREQRAAALATRRAAPAAKQEKIAMLSITKNVPTSAATDHHPAATKASPVKAPAKKRAAAKKTAVKRAGKAAGAPKKAKAAKGAPKAKKAASAAPKAARDGSKLETIVKLLTREQGCTTAEILEVTDWPTVSVPQQARAAGLKLRKVKEKGQPTRYYGTAA